MTKRAPYGQGSLCWGCSHFGTDPRCRACERIRASEDLRRHLLELRDGVLAAFDPMLTRVNRWLSRWFR